MVTKAEKGSTPNANAHSVTKLVCHMLTITDKHF